MATVQTQAEQRFVLYGVSWETYQKLLVEQGDRPIRLTYDRGVLELMTLSFEHERWSRLINRLIETLTEELGIPLVSGGSTSFHREDVDRGLEPDECYWIRNAARVLGKDELDLTVDPPPDLAVEIDISYSSMARQEIYAALGVPELWRFDGRTLQVFQLGADGRYVATTTSPSFPFLPLSELGGLLHQASSQDMTTWVRSFRAWVRQEILPRLPGAGAEGD